MSAQVYVKEGWPQTPVALRIDGHLLPVVSGESVNVTFNDQGITTVTATMFAPGIEVIAVASEEEESLLSEALAKMGDAK